MRQNTVIRIVAVALVALCIFCRPSIMFAATIPPESRKAAPDFTLTNAQGVSFSLTQFKGKVVLLDFWATWCHGCKTEIPWYVGFQNTYKQGGLSVIGVSMDEGWKSVRSFITEHNVNYVVGIAGDAITKEYNINSLPVTLLIDRQGRMAETHVGVVDKDAFEQDIRGLLNEGSPPISPK